MFHIREVQEHLWSWSIAALVILVFSLKCCWSWDQQFFWLILLTVANAFCDQSMTCTLHSTYFHAPCNAHGGLWSSLRYGTCLVRMLFYRFWYVKVVAKSWKENDSQLYQQHLSWFFKSIAVLESIHCQDCILNSLSYLRLATFSLANLWDDNIRHLIFSKKEIQLNRSLTIMA